MMELLKKAVEKVANSFYGRHVMILIDVSGSMYKSFEMIKEAVKELIKQISMRNNSTFNIISFSKLNCPFSDQMESCTDDNLKSAYSWISSLRCENTTNTLSGLVAAFSEQNCDSVVLFTDSLPNHRPSIVLKCVNELSQGRPISSVYINNGNVDPIVEEFLISLSVSTNGSSHTLTQFNNALECKQSFPPSKEITTYCYESSSSFSETSDDEEVIDKRFPLNIAEKFCVVGKTVFARRIHDGYFYKGSVVRSYPDIDEVLVSFLPSKKTLQYESIALSDLILYDDIKNLKAYVGDRVLVNFDGKKKYVPGTVREIKNDSSELLSSSSMLKIEMFDGEIKRLPLTSVFPIQEEVYLESVNSILNNSHSIATKIVVPTVKRHRGRKHYKHTGKFFTKDSKKLLSREELSERIEAQLKESKALLNSLNIYEEPVNLFHHHHLRSVSSYDGYDSGFAGESTEDLKNSRVIFSKPLYLKRKSVEEDSSDSSISEGPQKSNIKTRCFNFPPPSVPSPNPPSSWNNGQPLPHSHWKRKHSSSVGSNVVERSKKHWIGRPLNKDMSHLKAKRFNKKPFADDYQTVDGTPMPRKTDYHVKKIENSTHFHESDIPYYRFQHHDIIGHRVVDYKPVYEPSPPSPANKCRVKGVQENKVNISHEQKEHIKRENEAIKQEEKKKKQLEHHKQLDANDYKRIKIIIERDDNKMDYKHKKHKDRIEMENHREDSKQNQKFARIEAKREKLINHMSVGTSHGNVETQTERPPSQKRLDFERARVENQIQSHEAKIQRLKTLRKYTDARVETLKRNNDKARDLDNHVKDQKLANVRASILP